MVGNKYMLNIYLLYWEIVLFFYMLLKKEERNKKVVEIDNSSYFI